MPSASLSARERRNPPPRRKSCTACVRSKRRCDAALPSCFRCQQRRIPCQYAGSPRPTSVDAIIAWQDDAFHEDTSSSSTDLELPEPTDAAQELNDLSFLASCLDTSPLNSVQQDGFLMAPVSRHLEFASDVFKTRLQYAVDVLKSAPTTMVLDTQTPWCHPQLYKNGMPKSMQDAFSSCALYMAKNETNAPIIFRSLDARIRELLSLPAPVNLVDCLAHIQALLLYQIIRLFDGDINARSSGEQLIPSLENAALQLLTYVRFDDHLSSKPDLPLYPIQPIKDIWEDWILQESARRTVLVTFYFLQAYRVLAGHVGLQCDGKLGLCHSWTLSSKLWDANTTVEFAQAWKARQYYVVTNGQFAQVLQEAKAEDVDSFGRIWISSLLGIEETEGWFAARGGKLRMEIVR